MEKPGSLLPEPEEIQNLPLDLRKTHFTEMMLERGVGQKGQGQKGLGQRCLGQKGLGQKSLGQRGLGQM